MAHGHGFALVVLKTEKGYLTKTGTTEDIYSKELLKLPIYFIGGKWSKMEDRVKKFMEESTASRELFKDISKLETYTYVISQNGKVDLYKLYSI
ncbi:MAG: hypothetical protein E7311_06805 [Clostridiales bacterium]|nr:hypothetical protein [Clostridiales bacterium]